MLRYCFLHRVFFDILATTYRVSVKTGDVRGAGTDANAYIKLFGSNGDSGKVALKQSENTKNKFERGRVDEFVVEAMDIGEVLYKKPRFSNL